MARIPLLSAESELTPDQRRVVDAILGKRGGRIPGPFRFSLHCPEVTEAWHPLGEVLRLRSSFPLRLSELAVLIAARHWDSEYVFSSHAVHALKGGLAQSVIDAIAHNKRPTFEQRDEEVMYDYCTELFRDHKVSDATYRRALDAFGVPGVVELTALIGYYSMVAMTVIAHELPLPQGTAPLLK